MNQCFYQTPAGILHIFYTDEGIYKAEFCQNESDIHDELLADDSVKRLAHVLKGTDLQRAVWQSLVHIRPGQTISYQDLAQIVGKPRAWRAVASAVAANPIAYLVPCHRVIRSNGTLGGYRWGLIKKDALLKAEKLSL
jgi:O-6-methylguanine DNA methyltransferase